MKFKRIGSARKSSWSRCKKYYGDNSIIVVLTVKMFQKIKGGIMGKKPHVFYSGPTDGTGKALAEKLKATHGKTKPTGADKICICWGCKTDKTLNMGKMPVLNHPDKIKANRHKFNTLRTLAAAGVYVGNFTDAKSIMAALTHPTGDEPMALPCIGRKNYHQGGKDFHTCLTKGHVDIAIKAGAAYFRNFLEVKVEYRLHVFQGVVINAQRKTERKNMGEAFTNQHAERITANAAKKNMTLDKATMEHVLQDIGGREGHPNQIIKSNTKGWQFSQIKLANVKNDLAAAAIAAVEAAGLDFAAVDCVMLVDGRPAVIELNTGPGLEGTSFEAYVKAFQEAIKAINNPPKQQVAASSSRKTNPVAAKTGKKIKADPEKLRMLAEMMETADGDEKQVLDNVFTKMFG